MWVEGEGCPQREVEVGRGDMDGGRWMGRGQWLGLVWGGKVLR